MASSQHDGALPTARASMGASISDSVILTAQAVKIVFCCSRVHARRTMITIRFVCAMVAVCIGTCAAGMARAQSYPDKLIRMIVPAPPGGQTDVLARHVAQRMQAALGHNVIVDNRPGAGGAIGARVAAAAEPDGYTLL